MKYRPVVCGIDAGSTSIKITIFDGEKTRNWLAPAGWSPKEAAVSLLGRALQDQCLQFKDIKYFVGTGYGRVALSFLSKTMTEIACHAKGAVHLRPGVRTVIDVGGQDAKAIHISEAAKVSEFIMNDKCAAGTGKFLEVTAHALGMDITEFSRYSPEQGQPPCQVTSMCAVFAESEVITLLNRGYEREAIVKGLYKSIASRIVTMAARVNPTSPVVFTGGVSRNAMMRFMLEEELGCKVEVPEDAVFAGSIGAAIFAWEDYLRLY
jgi:predicted CoA-substrate-specific enzyme activase